MNFNRSVSLDMLFFDSNMALRHILTGCSLAVVLGATQVGCMRVDSAPAADDTAAGHASRVLPVRVSTLTAIDQVEFTTTYTGVVASPRQAELAFKRPDRVMDVAVDDGDRVAANQVLAELDTRRLVARQLQLQAEYAQAAARLEELTAGPRAEVIAAQEARVRDLETRASQTLREFERRQVLVARRVVSDEVLEQADAQRRSVTAQLEAAQRQLDELQAGTRPEQLAAQRAVVDQLEASLQQVQIDLDDSQLRAPFAGVITRRYLDDGEVVTAGQAVFRLVADDDLEVRIGVPPRLARQVTEGSAHDVTIDDITFSATVDAVIAELDEATRTRTVILRLPPDATSQVVSGQLARITVRTPKRLAGFWIPTTALAPGKRGLWSVMALEERDGSLITVARDVEVLHTDGMHCVIRGTVQDGDRIVATGTHRVAIGQRVVAATATETSSVDTHP